MNNKNLWAIVSFLALVTLSASADDTNRIVIDYEKNIHFSAMATNGIKLGVFSYTQPPYTVEQPIELVFTIPKESLGVLLPENEYVGRFTLYGTNNLPLSKTALGESFKLKADLQWNSKLMRQQHITGGRAPRFWGKHSDNEWILYKGWSNPADFPQIDQLFKVVKPGNYRLVLEVQVFLETRGNRELVCFPPLEIPVIQPDKTNHRETKP